MSEENLLKDRIRLYEFRLNKAVYRSPYQYAIKCLSEELDKVLGRK